MGLPPLGICPTENRKAVATRVDRLGDEGLVQKCAKMMDHSVATHRAKYTFVATVDAAVDDYKSVREATVKKVKRRRRRQFFSDDEEEEAGQPSPPPKIVEEEPDDKDEEEAGPESTIDSGGAQTVVVVCSDEEAAVVRSKVSAVSLSTDYELFRQTKTIILHY